MVASNTAQGSGRSWPTSSMPPNCARHAADAVAADDPLGGDLLSDSVALDRGDHAIAVSLARLSERDER